MTKSMKGMQSNSKAPSETMMTGMKKKGMGKGMPMASSGGMGKGKMYSRMGMGGGMKMSGKMKKGY